MKSKLLIIVVSIVPLILISGCLEGGFSIDEPDYTDRETFDFVDFRDGHLEETESEMVFTVNLGDGEYITHFSCLATWVDEEPVERMREYYNEGDQFRVSISDGRNITRRAIATNPTEGVGNVYCFYPSDIVDSQTLSRPITLTVEIELVYAGDQYALYTNDETTKVEDTGNDYSCFLEYTITIETE